MEADDQPTAKRRQHLRVPVFPEEKELIEANAKRAGVSVARSVRKRLSEGTVLPMKVC